MAFQAENMTKISTLRREKKMAFLAENMTKISTLRREKKMEFLAEIQLKYQPRDPKGEKGGVAHWIYQP